MICWKTVKEFFGSGTKAKQPLTEGATKSSIKKQSVSDIPNRPPAPATPRKKAPINARNYYRRSGLYYSNDDDSIIEDAILLLALIDLYNAGEIFEQDEIVQERWNVPETNIFNGETDIVEEPTEDLLDVDVGETPVVSVEEVSTTPVYDPKPTQEDYSSGYSDSSSSYDSGSSSCDSCD